MGARISFQLLMTLRGSIETLYRPHMDIKNKLLPFFHNNDDPLFHVGIFHSFISKSQSHHLASLNKKQFPWMTMTNPSTDTYRLNKDSPHNNDTHISNYHTTYYVNSILNSFKNIYFIINVLEKPRNIHLIPFLISARLYFQEGNIWTFYLLFWLNGTKCSSLYLSLRQCLFIFLFLIQLILYHNVVIRLFACPIRVKTDIWDSTTGISLVCCWWWCYFVFIMVNIFIRHSLTIRSKYRESSRCIKSRRLLLSQIIKFHLTWLHLSRCWVVVVYGRWYGIVKHHFFCCSFWVMIRYVFGTEDNGLRYKITFTMSLRCDFLCCFCYTLSVWMLFWCSGRLWCRVVCEFVCIQIVLNLYSFLSILSYHKIGEQQLTAGVSIMVRQMFVYAATCWSLVIGRLQRGKVQRRQLSCWSCCQG